MYFGIFRGIIARKKYVISLEFRVLLSAPYPLGYRHIHFFEKMRKSLSADYLSDKSQNLSSYITECGSLEKLEILQEKCQLIERRTFSEIFVVLSS